MVYNVYIAITSSVVPVVSGRTLLIPGKAIGFLSHVAYRPVQYVFVRSDRVTIFTIYSDNGGFFVLHITFHAAEVFCCTNKKDKNFVTVSLTAS